MKILLKGRVLLISLITTLLILGALSLYTAYLSQDENGVWYIRNFGVEVIYQPDQPRPSIWVYFANYLVWRLRLSPAWSPELTPLPGGKIEGLNQEKLPDEVPDPSPATPTPIRRGPMELQQAQRVDQPERQQPGLLAHKRPTATINEESSRAWSTPPGMKISF